MKKKTKGGFGQWFGVAIYLLIGAACGLLIVRYIDLKAEAGARFSGLLLSMAFLLVLMYAAMILQIIIHEAGHLVFGLLSGYRFSSFRIFSFMLAKEEGGLRLRRMNVAGTGGQCLMAPPDMVDGKIPVMLYNFGGSLMNLIASALSAGLSLLFPAYTPVWLFLVFLAVIGAAFALINGLPLHMGPVNNDGRNALDLARDPVAVRAFWTQLKVTEEQARGVRLKEMPEAWFAVPSDAEMQNGITAAAGVSACGRLMDEHRFAEADALMEHYLAQENAIVGLYRNLMVCDRMYVELIGDARPDVLESMRTKDQLKIMKSMQTFLSVIRTDYAYALLAERDTEKAASLRKKFEKAADSYPYPGEAAAERELIAIAEERAAQRQQEAAAAESV
ncbi:MAG: M50 family metallopeptidase [Lachnospiraceae bacterium]|nr:M50 family metallopeptidase [Lachnospiraceae bacterium]